MRFFSRLIFYILNFELIIPTFLTVHFQNNCKIPCHHDLWFLEFHVLSFFQFSHLLRLNFEFNLWNFMYVFNLN